MSDSLALFDSGPSPEEARALMGGRPAYPCPICSRDMTRLERHAGKCLACHNAGFEPGRLDLAPPVALPEPAPSTASGGPDAWRTAHRAACGGAIMANIIGPPDRRCGACDWRPGTPYPAA